jgi:hypothetical protein
MQWKNSLLRQKYGEHDNASQYFPTDMRGMKFRMGRWKDGRKDGAENEDTPLGTLPGESVAGRRQA